MASFFPEPSRPTGSEAEIFLVRLRPILDQMEILQLPPTHRPAVLFSLLTRNACQAASKISLAGCNIESFESALKRAVLYNREIEDRQVTC